MNTKLLLIILVCPGFFGSCTTSKMLTSDGVHFSMSHIKKSNIFEVQPELTNL